MQMKDTDQGENADLDVDGHRRRTPLILTVRRLQPSSEDIYVAL